MDNLIKVGKVIDAHSLKGEIYAIIFSGDSSWSDEIQNIFLKKESEESFEKFEVDYIKPHKDGLRVKFKTIIDRTQAESLKGKLIYIDEQFFISDPGETIYLRELLDFSVIGPDSKKIGTVIEFLSSEMQDILVLKPEVIGSIDAYEIPFVDEFIVEINHDEKWIKVELPEGLLEINKKE